MTRTALACLLLALPVLPIAWAGIKLGHSLPPEYSGLAIGLALESTTVSGAAFVAGLAEALDDPDQRALVAASLSLLQQRALRLAEEDRG